MVDDELAKKVAEAKKKMFGSPQSSGNIVLLVSGEAKVTSNDSKVQVRKVR